MIATDSVLPKRPMAKAERTFSVVCLCAEWCGVCRDYRPVYDALVAERGDVDFHWVDIEDEADWPDELEVESFPTLMIQRGEWVLFFGPTLPQAGHLLRMLDSFAAFTEAEARDYVAGTAERRSWQKAGGFPALLAQR